MRQNGHTGDDPRDARAPRKKKGPQASICVLSPQPGAKRKEQGSLPALQGRRRQAPPGHKGKGYKKRENSGTPTNGLSTIGENGIGVPSLVDGGARASRGKSAKIGTENRTRARGEARRTAGTGASVRSESEGSYARDDTGKNEDKFSNCGKAGHWSSECLDRRPNQGLATGRRDAREPRATLAR